MAHGRACRPSAADLLSRLSDTALDMSPEVKAVVEKLKATYQKLRPMRYTSYTFADLRPIQVCLVWQVTAGRQTLRQAGR